MSWALALREALDFGRAHWRGVVIVALIAFASIQTLRARHLKSDLGSERHSFGIERGLYQAERSAFVASERDRGLEHQSAVRAIGDAEASCATRVSAARRSGSLIRQIVETPVVEDPQTHCPVRGVIGADQLRHAAGLP